MSIIKNKSLEDLHILNKVIKENKPLKFVKIKVQQTKRTTVQYRERELKEGSDEFSITQCRSIIH